VLFMAKTITSPDKVIAYLQERVKEGSKVIAITGNACSGKSYLTKQLQKQFSCAVLNTDKYYFNKEERRKKNITGAHPDSFDSVKLTKGIVMLKKEKEIVIVDSLSILLLPGWRRLIDVVVFLDCPKSILWKRKQKEGEDKALFELRYDQFKEFILSQKGKVDVVVNQEQSSLTLHEPDTKTIAKLLG
jgi:uridine kinase